MSRESLNNGGISGDVSPAKNPGAGNNKESETAINQRFPTEDQSPREEKKPARALAVETTVLYALSLVATFASHHVQATPWNDIAFGAVLVVLLGGPWAATRFVNRRSPSEAGAEIVLSARDALKGVGVLAAIALPVVFGSWVWFCLIGGHGVELSARGIHTAEMPVWTLVANQLLLVALPEEFFYRGYLMTTLRNAFPGGGARKTAAVVCVTSLMFAAAHVMGGDPVRLVTFFPALLFGLLRTRCEGILGCMILHAGCNLLMQFIVGCLV